MTMPLETREPSAARRYRAGALLLATVGGLAAFLPFSIPARNSATEGTVLDDRGKPLASATVRLKATANATRTDSSGRFRLPRGNDRVTAWKAGYFIGGVGDDLPAPSLRLTSLPEVDDASYEWVDPAPGGSTNCGTCHEAIYREWAGSAHARSATGSHFRDLYAGTDAAGRPGVSWGLRREYPDGAGVCSSCHAPGVGDHDVARFDLGQIQGVAARGVHCDYCHKIVGTGEGPPGLTHGSFDLRLLRPARGQLFVGPLDDVDRGEDSYSPLYRDSRYCASCHEGIVFGVHVYSTFSEWLASPARREGKQCQDCHMAPTGVFTNIAPGHGGVDRDPRTLASHSLFTGSQAEMLRQSVRVNTSIHAGVEALRAEVRVLAEGVGHRLPTGFIDRHVLLVVDAFDVKGQPLSLTNGSTLPGVAGPELAGRAGRVYGRLRSDFEGRTPIPFWHAGTDGKDTRLVPGVADVSGYDFPSSAVQIRIRLLYRRFWREVVDAKGWPDRDVVVFDEELATSK